MLPDASSLPPLAPSTSASVVTINVANSEPQPPSATAPARLSSPSFFISVLTGQRRFRIFLLSLLLGLFACIQPSYQLFKYGLPYVNNLDQKITAAVDEAIPDQVQVTIKNGVASSNVTEPYFITISQSTLSDLFDFGQGTGNARQPQSKIRLLTIDTQGRLEDFEKFESQALLTSRNVVYYSNGDTKIQSLSSYPDMTLNKQIILGKISDFNRGGRVTNFLKLLIYSSPVLIIIGYSLFFLLDVLLVTVLVWLVSKIVMGGLRFSGLYAFTFVFYFPLNLILTVLRYFPQQSITIIWLNTFADVLIPVLAYLLISAYRQLPEPS